MEQAIARFESTIASVCKDIDEAKGFKADLYNQYPGNSLDDRIKIQSMILKISDLISQKRMTKVELERQLDDYKKAYEEEKAVKA